MVDIQENFIAFIENHLLSVFMEGRALFLLNEFCEIQHWWPLQKFNVDFSDNAL
jgi:hypothetical protein